MLRVGGLDFAEELRNVRIVPEADEGLGFVACNHHVVALVLTAELVVVLDVERSAAVALDAHVAGGVPGVIPVEADGEVAVEVLHGLFAHQAGAFLVHERAVVDIEQLPAGLHQHAHLHRDEIEDPGAVAHFPRQVPQALHVASTPDAFEIAGLGAERVLYELRADVRKGFEGHHLEILRVVVKEIPVYPSGPEQFAAQAYGTFEVAVVAAADGPVDDSGPGFADIGIFPPADAQDGVFRGKVEEALHVVEVPESRDQRTVAEHGDHRTGNLFCRQRLFQRFGLILIHQTLVTTVEDLSVQQGGVDLGVPDEQRVDKGVDLRPALEGFPEEVNRLKLKPPQVAFPPQQVDE